MNDKKPIFSLGENKLTTNYESILDLGLQPWGNDFLTKENLGNENTYPLHLVYCNESNLLQLDYFVKKETMFLNHTYVTTPSLLKDFYKIAEENVVQYSLDSKNDTILDIGGNDGSQLLQYRKLGFNKIINFESAKNIAELSNKNQVYCINNFFNLNTAKSKLKEKSIKLINASGVFFHLEELDSVIKGINYCLSDDGIFVVQFMYAGTMIENLNFDTIYHEHLCYYTVNSIIKLLEKYDIHIQDAYFTELHSGSIVAKFRKYKSEKTQRCIDLIEKDKKYNLESFKEFSKKIEAKRYDLKNLLVKLKSENKKIYGYGAPVKGNTLMNYMGINNTLIDKIVEINTLKVGLYTPGSHIPVELENPKDLPDYYLLLSHNFVNEIIIKNKDIIDKGVKFIVPFPEIQTI
jgi:hypothetical protein